MSSKYIQALAVSDTHGNKYALKAIVRAYTSVPYLFHLGDNVRDADWLAERMSGTIILNVKGNCDPGTKASLHAEIIIKGQRILLTHGHTLDVKWGYDRALYYAQEHHANALLFGHTHRAEIEREDGIWLINPGSAGEPRGDRPTVAMLIIGEAGIVPKIIPLAV